MKWLFNLCITIFFIPIILSAQDNPGVFTIEGFSSPQLIWQELDADQPQVICSLGTTPNRLAIHGEFLYVVHSGSFSDGTGTELWRAPVAELLEEPNPDWQVLELPLFSNPWDVAFSAQDPQLGFVSLLLNNAVQFIDLENWSLLSTVAAGANPQGIVEFQERLYVCASGFGSGTEVSVIDVEAQQQVDTFEVATNPQAIMVEDGLLNLLCSGITYPPDNGALIQWLNPETGEIVDELALGNNAGVMAGREDGVVVVGDEWAIATDPVLFYDSQTHDLLETSFASGGFALATGFANSFYIGSGVSGELVRLDAEFNVTNTFAHGNAIVDIVEYAPLENVAHNNIHPTELNLVTAAPNPFNPGTLLRFDLSQATTVTADLYDVLGRHCRHIPLGQISAGQQQFYLDGSELAGGVYFLHLQAGLQSQTLKLTRLP